MALRLALFLLLLLSATATATATAAETVASDLARTAGGATPTCDGLVGECAGDGEEDDVEGEEETRRFLYGHAGSGGRARFISYDALKRDRVPCDRRGQSYYNCQRSGRANPYRRGCTVITHCARMLH